MKPTTKSLLICAFGLLLVQCVSSLGPSLTGHSGERIISESRVEFGGKTFLRQEIALSDTPGDTRIRMTEL